MKSNRGLSLSFSLMLLSFLYSLLSLLNSPHSSLLSPFSSLLSLLLALSLPFPLSLFPFPPLYKNNNTNNNTTTTATTNKKNSRFSSLVFSFFSFLPSLFSLLSSSSFSLACLLAWGMRAETLWPVGLPPRLASDSRTGLFRGRSEPIPLNVPVRFHHEQTPLLNHDQETRSRHHTGHPGTPQPATDGFAVHPAQAPGPPHGCSSANVPVTIMAGHT